ncbi:hypothetical protein BCR39DRAFT_532845 [Naematelia encephala]|uniref:ZZ-type domain-containing protein n=1 Tax=Naematelia encephala TaxID=71784 RepID=A0A1Y2B338_9TREE|nr:hypothetical protein BCR39DRAFT_532845 [Naematelia encephala]
MSKSAAVIPDRPNRPLIIKCGYSNSTRRVTFPSASTCRLESLRSRVEECFHLSASPFSLTYTDDDGEEFPLRCESDLTEAILYFVSGDDTSIRSGYAPVGQKITIKVEVVVEYDGPSLSDTSSVSSFRTGTESARESWASSSGQGSLQEQDELDAFTESGESLGATSIPSARYSLVDPFAGLSIQTRQEEAELSPNILNGHTRPQTPLFGPKSAPAPDLLTDSELGSRWLREQSRLVTRRLGPGSRSNASARRRDSDEDSNGSDAEYLGDLALVRDARGKFYYSYQTDSGSVSDFDEPDAGPSRPIYRHNSSSSTSTASPPDTPRLEAEPAGPPIFAPDCSACGVRLDYMRYVCLTCGEGAKWKVNAPGKEAFVPPREPSDTSHSDGSSETEWAARESSSGEGTAHAPRSRSGSISTSASRGSLSPMSPRSHAGDIHDLYRGYELCPGCIEVHGLIHTKAFAKKRRRGLRHTFREKIWGPEGWVDVEYNEDSYCTICRSRLFRDRFKCVSCPKFDLCRACYHKVDEIHPAHAFLSLPDGIMPITMPFHSSGISEQNSEPPSQLIRHPGAFCHNCLQDIVGPRFHCAVCPSWDLCIQCEGVGGAGDGTHAPDHIMMKIPLPLANAEVEAVSRRARDRWYRQDSAAVSTTPAASTRSSSPTNETVYAPGAPHTNTRSSRVISEAPRDALDHGCRCANCNEWIMGRRYQCANCPSEPIAFNLCSICELRSYRIHNPRHLFFKLDRPVHIPLTSRSPLLPILYKTRAGDLPVNATVDPRDPTAYLKHVIHRETLCDIHGDQIRGAWLRCVHCAAGFDICQEAEMVADHDPTHVFVVFKARVDMAKFRQVADLGSEQSKALITQQVYLT